MRILTLAVPKKAKKLKNKEKYSLEIFAVCAYYLSMPLTFVTLIKGMSILKLITIPIAFFLVILMFVGKHEVSFNCVHLIYALYILYAFASLLILNIDESVTIVQDMSLAFAVMIMATCKVYNQREKQLISYTWLLVGLISALLCVTSQSTIAGDRTVIVIMGSREDPNQFCAYFILPILYALDKVVKREKIIWLFSLPYIVIIFYAILKTGSRGGLIGIVCAVACFIAIGIKNLKTKIIIFTAIILVVVIFLGIIFPMLPAVVQERYSVERVQEDKGSGRFDIWNYLVQYVFEHPQNMLTGFGLCSTLQIMKDALFSNGYAHNQWIQEFIDQGIIGLILFTLLLAACFFRNIKSNLICSCAIVALIAFTMSLTFYTFKPYVNIIMLSAMSFEGELSSDRIRNKLTFYQKLRQPL